MAHTSRDGRDEDLLLLTSSQSESVVEAQEHNCNKQLFNHFASLPGAGDGTKTEVKLTTRQS